MQTMKIPVVYGRNQLRGGSTGAMIDESGSANHLERLKSQLKKEAAYKRIEPSDSWLAKAVEQLLHVYDEGYEKWQKDRQSTIGFVCESVLPSGVTLLFADARTLREME